MAVDRRWINWSTSVTSAILLVFCLAQAVIAFYMNLDNNINQDEKLAITGASLVSLGVLVFPTAWVGFSAAISRHRGVYIAFLVMVCLSLLDSIGMLVYQAYIFDTTGSYIDSEAGVAIAMTIIQCLLILVLFFAIAFAAAAQCPRKVREKRPSQYYPSYAPTGAYGTAPPMYNREYGPALSLPRAGGYDYSTEPRMYYKSGRY
ncbi:uncharacterized protein [Watersipora subatra]|uniref:uncharacterized protein isoform X1 n=1 Tax=Watersipora subatra TaxID=2589382 RepID=UPI00355BA0AC